MPVNKSALLRYRIIDSCLTNTLKKFPTKEFLISKIEEQIGTSISDSMLAKDLEDMRREYQAPIAYDRTRRGYYYTEREFSIKKFPLTHAEIEVLDFSTALLQHFKNTPMYQQFENAINKVIEGYRIRNIIGKSEKQVLQVEEPLRTEGNQWLEIILKSIIEKECLKVTYQGFGREKKEHAFSCYLLKEYRNRWYAAGYSSHAEHVLVLALDRMIDVEPCEAKYISDDDFNPEDFFRYSIGITQFHAAKPEKIVLSFTPAEAPYIAGQPLHASQKIIRQNAKELRIQLEVYITQELKMIILSYGPRVKVVSPKILRDEIKELISGMADLYK